MANPIRLFLRIAEDWDRAVDLNGMEKGRGVGTGLWPTASDDAWAVHRRAIMHLNAIEAILLQMIDRGHEVGFALETITRLTAYVMARNSGWGARDEGLGLTSDVLSPDTKGMLQLLATQFDTWGVTPEIPELTRGTIAEVVDEAIQLLDDSALPEDFAHHLYDLLSHVRTCIENYEIFGDFELNKAIQRLMTLMLMSAGASESDGEKEEASKWREQASKLLATVVVGVGSGVTSNVLTHLALTAGS